MTWRVTEPVATDSLATSQPKLAANFSHIQSVLGSSTLSAGISKVAGDLFYAYDAHTIQRLAKATGSYILTNYSSGGNPSWATPDNFMSGVKSAANLEMVGNIKAGTWSGTAITPAKGGTGVTVINKGSVAVTSQNTSITFTTAHANTDYVIVATHNLNGYDEPAGNVNWHIDGKSTTGFVFSHNNDLINSKSKVEYITFGD